MMLAVEKPWLLRRRIQPLEGLERLGEVEPDPRPVEAKLLARGAEAVEARRLELHSYLAQALAERGARLRLGPVAPEESGQRLPAGGTAAADGEIGEQRARLPVADLDRSARPGQAAAAEERDGEPGALDRILLRPAMTVSP